MNPRELVDHIRSGPAELVLQKPLRFRDQTRFNPCNFNELLLALQSSETIRTAACGSRPLLGISEDEWVLLVETLGSIKSIKNLKLHCTQGSRDFHPCQALAEAVNNAQSLCKLEVIINLATVSTDPSGLAALANALREHTPLNSLGLIGLV
jgi:hypothetical protein